jgi:hypothetical protein
MTARRTASTCLVALALSVSGCAAISTPGSTKDSLNFAIRASKAAAQEGPKLLQEACGAARAAVRKRPKHAEGCLRQAVSAYLETLTAHHYDPQALARGR